MSSQIQLRRGAVAEWESSNPILAEGEAGFETDTGVIRVGDGVTAWLDLPHIRQRSAQQFGGRFYMKTNAGWVSPAQAYGFASENQYLDLGTDVDPAPVNGNIGLLVEAGDIVSGVRLAGRADAGLDCPVEFALMFISGDGAAGYASLEISQRICTSAGLFPDSDMRRYSLQVGFEVPQAGMLVPAFRPDVAPSTQRYLYISGMIDLLI